MAEKGFRTSLAGRSIVALVLFVGYYVLAIAVAGLLLVIPYGGVRLHLTGGLYVWALYLACIAAAAIILWSIVPRRQRFKEPGPRLTPESDPRLFEEIYRVAREMGQKAPREAYLALGVDAWVGGRGGFMGIGSRRIVGVGLTLLGGLSVSEFRAVLAHEFGHFRRGDTRLGPWIYKTRSTIGQTIQKLPVLSTLGKTGAALGSVIQRPFVLYGNWFLRITQAISRHQEYSADELAAGTSGRDGTASALRKTYMMDLALQMFWGSVMGPALNAGYLPPFAAGVGQFAGGEAVRGDLTKALNWHIENVQSEPHDSHPSLGERLKALAALPAGREPEAGPPAITLVEDVPRRERELFAFLNPEAGPKLRPLDWGDVATAALVPHWAQITAAHQAELAGMTPKGLPDKLPGLAEWGQQMGSTLGQALTDDQAKSFAMSVIAVAVVTKMIERGWQASYALGQYTVLRHGERSWEPFKKVYAFAGGETTADEWLKLCDEMGIGDLELGPGEVAQGVEPVRERSGPPETASAPAPTSDGRRKASPLPYVLIGLIGLAIAALIFSPRPDGRGGNAPRQTSSGAEPYFSLSIYDLDLAASVIKSSSGAGTYGATVAVTNRSSRTYHSVLVKIEFCDRAGRVVGALMTDARRDEYILPGAVRSFTVIRNGRLDFQTARATVVYAVKVR